MQWLNGAQGFLLLTIEGVDVLLDRSSGTASTTNTLKCEAVGRVHGQLSVECVTLPDPDTGIGTDKNSTGGRDVFLVLRVDSHEFAIAPTQVIIYDVENRTFAFHGTPSSIPGISSPQEFDWIIRFSPPETMLQVEDYETFEVLLQQYAALSVIGDKSSVPQLPPYEVLTNEPSHKPYAVETKRPVPLIPIASSSSSALLPPPLPPRPHSPSQTESNAEYRRQLVLVDENDGQIIGSLGDQFTILEDTQVMAEGHEKDPVFIELPDDIDPGEGSQMEVWVHPVPLEQQCNIMKTSSYISRGIVLAASTITSGMRSASNMYISRLTPRAEPIVFSERANRNVGRIHVISGKAVQVTAKTTGLVHEVIEKAVDYVAGGDNNKKKGKVNDSSTSNLNPSTDGKPPKLSLKTRLLMSTDMILTTIEQSTKEIIEHGTDRLSEAMEHKYGHDMGNATRSVGNSARNVGLVYIDVRGVGRRALLKKAGKRYIKAKLGKKDVILGVNSEESGIAIGRT